MKSTSVGRFVILALALSTCNERLTADPVSIKQDKGVAAGNQLFVREWLQGDKRSHAGDGLGPLFNARSCVACHHQGGVGGAGPKQNNATIVSAFVQLNDGPININGVMINQEPDPKKPIKQPDRRKLAEIHPALRTESSFPFHRFSSEKAYTKWKVQTFVARNGGVEFGPGVFVSGAVDESVHELSVQNVLFQANRTVDGINIALIPSQRNTPALFGAGVIDRIPNRVLEEVASEQQKSAEAGRKTQAPVSPEKRDPSVIAFAEEVALPISGRVARLKDGRVGRFGWKAHVATLREFTFQACSNELGLEVPGFHRPAPPWKKNYQAPGLDLTEEQCDQLARFVASLPAPVTRPPETAQHAAEIAAGQKLFASVGCVACHRPKLGEVEGIYSDLLLHDMGQSLSDTGSYSTNVEIAADGEVKPLPVSDFGVAQSPAKEKPPKFGAAAREWRTPPLWGFRDSAPYLHDGRADTVADAVGAHGGEGLTAAKAFLKLAPRERLQVELFLQSLAAPTPVAAASTP
jgi:CxxC motif-containing protein (DUF1111 family)